MSDLGLVRDAEARGPLVGRVRATLRGVLRKPGEVYQPVYVGPLPNSRDIWTEVSRQARAIGMEAVRSYDDWRSSGYKPGVILMSVDGLRSYGEATHYRSRPGSQIVCWGVNEFGELPRELRDWISASGLVLEPEVTGVEPEDEEIREALTRCMAAVQRGEEPPYNPLTIVTEEGAQEAQQEAVRIRLGGGGIKVSLDEGGLEAGGVKPSLVWRLASLDALAMKVQADKVRQALENNTLVVLVGSLAEIDKVRTLAQWRDMLTHGEVLRLYAEQQVEGDHAWPDLVDVLVSAPATRVGDAKYETRWNERVDGELPRLMELVGEVARRVGTHEIMVYGPNRFAQFVVANEAIQSTAVSGDIWTVEMLAEARGERDWGAAAEALAIERMWRVLNWPSSQVLVARIGEPEGQGPAVAVDAVLAAAFGADDSRPRRAGLGPEAIWEITDKAKVEVLLKGKDCPARLKDVALLLDGTRCLCDVSGESGVLPLGLANILEVLARTKAATLSSCAEEDSLLALEAWCQALPTAQVGSALMGHGMLRAAIDMISAAADTQTAVGKNGGRLDADALFVLGYAMVIQHGPTREAALVFSQAWQLWQTMGAGDDLRLYLDRRLDATLIEGRAGMAEWVPLWRNVMREVNIVSGKAQFSWTPRHYLILGEIALRGGDRSQAQKAAARLEKLWRTSETNTVKPRWVLDLVGSA